MSGMHVKMGFVQVRGKMYGGYFASRMTSG
jgi:hypothetical protein